MLPRIPLKSLSQPPPPPPLPHCCVSASQTCDEGRHPPANQVVESHWPVVDVSHFADHAVDVKALQEEPGEGAQVEEVQEDGDDRAHKLQPG